ncbi:MAG: hypothetical protein AAF738_11035, partial [Bacteroidota bacterium]
MRQHLIRMAMLTSPIIALYGVAPVLLFFEGIDLPRVVFSIFMLSIGIFMFWLFNIFLLHKKNSPLFR